MTVDKDSRADADKIHVLGKGIIAGLPVTKLDQGNGNVVYRAPSLGCVVAATFADWDQNCDHCAFPGATSAIILDRASLGEPDPGLFQIPTDYVEQPFSVPLTKRLQGLGFPESVINNQKAANTVRDLAWLKRHPGAQQAAPK